MESKYKIGQKVRVKSLDWYNKNKDEDGDISCGEFDFVKGMKKFCSEVFTISENVGDGYLMLEDKHGYVWTDEMIDCLAEYESKNTEDINRESYVKAESNKYFQEYMNSLCKEHDEMIEGLMKDGTIVDYVKESNDRYRIVIDPRFDIEVDEGEYYAVRRKKEYPKTFLGCCDVLGIEDLISRGVNGYRSELLDAFQKLLICRDAYWQIAGEEMGLGKPWEPDYTNTGEKKFSIWVDFGEIKLGGAFTTTQMVLSFPTEEMRDAFFNAFGDDIENCKELI
jgi:hypothetical protein